MSSKATKAEKKLQKLRQAQVKELQKLAQKEQKALKSLESERVKELKKIDSKRKPKPGESNASLRSLQPPDRELNFMFKNLLRHLEVPADEVQQMTKLSAESKWLFLCQHRASMERTAEATKLELVDPARHFIVKLQGEPSADTVADLAMTLSTADDSWFHSFRELNGPALLLQSLLLETERPEGAERTRKLAELVNCIKLVMMQPEGLHFVMRTRGAVTKITQCLLGAESKTKITVYEILIALCQAGQEEGFKLVLESMVAYKYVSGEKQLFQHLVDTVRYDPSAKARLLAMTVINMLCNTPDDVDMRVQTRNQFYRLDISGLIEAQRSAGTCKERLLRQFSAFEQDAAADAKEDSERFVDASFDLNSVDELFEQLQLRTKANSPVRHTFTGILRHLIQLPATDEGARLWMVVERLVSQVLFQKGELLMDESVNLDLDQVLLAVDDKIQLDVLQKKVEELKADHRKQMDAQQLRYEKQIQLLKASGGGPPPPPPPPGGGGKAAGGGGGGLFANRKKWSQQPKPNVPMKLLNWQKIPNNKVAKSVFGDSSALSATERTEAIQFDYSDLEDKFGRKPSAKRQAADQTLKAAKGGGDQAKKGKVQEIIPARRAQNVGVILKTLPVKQTIEIRDAIESCNLSMLTPDNVIKLADAVPTPEEYDMVKMFVEAGGDKTRLGATELFFLQIGDMPQMQPRLSCLLFCLRAPHRASEILEDVNKLLAGCRDVRHSHPFHRLLRIILELGNFVNGANGAKGNAGGFKVESLLQLEGSKDVKGTSNMLQWLYEFVEARHDDVLGWTRSVANVHAAANVSLQLAGQEFGELRAELAAALKHSELLEHGPAALPPTDPWHKTVPDMLLHARSRVAEVQAEHEKAVGEYKAVVEMFGEDPKQMASEDLFGVLRKFVEQWEATRQVLINRRQQEQRERERQIKKQARVELKNEMAAKLKQRNAEQSSNGGGGGGGGKSRSSSRSSGSRKAARPTEQKNPTAKRRAAAGEPAPAAAAAAAAAPAGGIAWAKLLEGVTGGDTFDARRREREIRRQATRGTQTLRRMAAQIHVQIKAKVLLDKKSGNYWARDRKDHSRLVYIAEKDRNGAQHGDIALVQMHQRTDGKVSGFVVEILDEQA